MVLHQSATLVILPCFSSSRLVIQWRASWTQVQSQQTILWQTSSVQYVSCTSANWMAEAHTASELRYKNYTGQGNTYFRWEHNLSYCLYAWRLDHHWVGTWVGSRIVLLRDVSVSLGKKSWKRTGDQWDLLCGFETVVDFTEKQPGNGCNLAGCAEEIWVGFTLLICLEGNPVAIQLV